MYTLTLTKSERAAKGVLNMKLKKKYATFDRGAEVQGLIEGTINPQDYQSVEAWVRKCWNMPSASELIMCALNEVLNGYGVEAVRGRYVDRYHQDIQASYVNMGDTYDLTILLDHETGKFVVTCLGDWFERNEKKRELS